MKNLFKYICKGSDYDTLQMVQENNHYSKNGHFQALQYISAPEPLWRIFQFEITNEHQRVVRLDDHLEYHNTVCSKNGQQDKAV